MERKKTPPNGHGRGARTLWQPHQPSTPRGNTTQPPTPRSPRPAPGGHAGWQAVEVTRGSPPFSRQATRGPGPTGPAPLAQSKASVAWDTLLGGETPLLTRRGTPQEPVFHFAQGGDARGHHSSIAAACADAWQQGAPQGLALLNAACEELDAPALWCRLLKQHAVQLLGVAGTASAHQFSGVVRAVRVLFEQGWCDPQSPWHVEPPARQALQTLLARLDPPLALRLALAEIEQRLRTRDSGPMSASQGLELLRRLHECAAEALRLPDFVLAQRTWALGERVAALFPVDAQGLDAAVRALANALGKTLRPALEHEHRAGLGEWIALDIGATPDSGGRTLTGVRLQGLDTDKQRQRALDELHAWLQAQLTRTPGQRLLHWADLQRVLQAVAETLSWQPSAQQRLQWCLLEARHGLHAEPLIALLSDRTADATIDNESLQAILRLATEPALALADRTDLLRRVLPWLPPKAEAPELHARCLHSLQAIDDDEMRALLLQRYDLRFGSAFPTQRVGQDHTPSARVREWMRQKDPCGGDWDELVQGLELSVSLSPMDQLLQGKGSVLLDRLSKLCQHANQQSNAERLAQVRAWAEQLLRRLKTHPEGATSLLRSRCELLCQHLLQAQHKACAARLHPWFEAAPRTSATLPLKCQRLDPQSPGLASAEARQQAWSLFLSWLELELSLPGGAPWDGVQALVDEVALALQIQPEAGLLSRLGQAHEQPAPEHPATEAPTAVTRWFSITSLRLSGHTQLSIRVARGAQAPDNDDDYQSAQTALLNWMLHELQKPDGADWPTVLDLVPPLENAWKPWRLDRQRLLGLCLWRVADTQTPDPMLKLLPLLEGPDETILSALLEQAAQTRWPPLTRATLLQAVIQRLRVGPHADASLAIQTLRAALAHDDSGTRLTLLAQYRQRHLGEVGSESDRLLQALLKLESLDKLTDAELIDTLEGIRQRERRAPRPLWLELCRVVLARVAPRLLALSRSSDASTSHKAGEVLRRLLWRMAHPQAGDKAQAIEDQFDLLTSLAGAIPSDQRVAFLQWLDQVYVRQIQHALQPQREGALPSLPMAALAMRGAVAVLGAKPGQLPVPPGAVGHAVVDAGTRFFTDWFHAARAPGDEAAAPPDADRSMARILLKIALFRLNKDPLAPKLEDPLAQELSAAADGLLRLHERQ